MLEGYVSREAAVKIAEKYGLENGSVLGRHSGLADCIASEIAALPAADVKEVVYCKDCKWLGHLVSGGYTCNIIPYCTPYDFCSRGVRKEKSDGQ